MGSFGVSLGGAHVPTSNRDTDACRKERRQQLKALIEYYERAGNQESADEYREELEKISG